MGPVEILRSPFLELVFRRCAVLSRATVHVPDPEGEVRSRLAVGQTVAVRWGYRGEAGMWQEWEGTVEGIDQPRRDADGADAVVSVPLPGLTHSRMVHIRDTRRGVDETVRALTVAHTFQGSGNSTVISYGKDTGWLRNEVTKGRAFARPRKKATQPCWLSGYQFCVGARILSRQTRARPPTHCPA